MKIVERWGCGGHYASSSTFLASLECELEGILGLPPKQIGNFRVDKDGSLRNNGYEYITQVPRNRQDLVKDFVELHNTLKFNPKTDPFSERTSTHVHVNVSSLEEEHARNIVLLYALFEELFFSMVKPNRRDNIHCVPLTETYLPKDYYRSLDGLHAHWHKYTALNLKRMADLGTMEFRHMHGTKDAKEVDDWLHVLENLWKLGQRIEINEKTLSDKKTITEWFELIFFPASRVIAVKPSLFDIIRNSLIDVKFSTFSK